MQAGFTSEIEDQLNLGQFKTSSLRPILYYLDRIDMAK